MKFKQKKLKWCPHDDCIFKRISQDKICGGELLEPQSHNSGDPPINIYRFCLRDILPNNETFDFVVHNQDIESMRWVFDSLNEKKTSWMGKA